MNIEINTQEARNSANELKAAAGEMETQLNEIKGLMSKIGEEEVWSGSSAEIAKEKFERLSSKFTSFSEAVQNCSDGVIQFADNYDEGEARINNLI